ncbi:MAG: hypothetical protein ACRD3E_04280 [Terriglobales bacterium]
MKHKRWPGILFIIGSIAIFVGTLDPMEGSVLIAAGSAVALASVLADRRPRAEVRYWIWTFASIAVGVALLFGWSAFGGFGGRSGHSGWWGLTLLPYPIGWWYAVRAIVRRGVDSWRGQRHRRMDKLSLRKCNTLHIA